MDLLRRRLIKGLSMVPLVSHAVPLSSQTSNQSSPSPKAVSANLALNVVRFFNTAELNYKLKLGTYGTVDELFGATSVSWFVNPRAANRKGYGEEFFRALRLGQEEIVSGWKLSIVKALDELAYSLTLRRTDESLDAEEQNVIFASDEQGVIFVGDLNSDRTMPKQYRSASSVMGVIPIDDSSLVEPVRKRGILSTALRNLSFANLPAAPLLGN